MSPTTPRPVPARPGTANDAPQATTPMSATRTVTRRSLTAGAVWAAPVVAVGVTAPAYAASPCAEPGSFRLDWGVTPYTKINANSGTATVSPTSGSVPAVVVSIGSAVNGSVDRATENLTVASDTNVGGLGAGARALQLAHDAPISSGRNNRQTVTFTFSRAVTGLSFTISDIDSVEDSWRDRVELSGSRAAVLGSRVAGAGTSSDPWRNTNNDSNLGVTDNRGNVTVTYAGSVTSVTLIYWNADGNSNQRIYISDLTFTAAC